jgi:hypothetical protein
MITQARYRFGPAVLSVLAALSCHNTESKHVAPPSREVAVKPQTCASVASPPLSSLAVPEDMLVKAQGTRARVPKETVGSVNLYWPAEQGTECSATIRVERSVPPCTEPLAFALQQLLAGVTDPERDGGAKDPMQRSVASAEAKPLRTYFRSIAATPSGAIVLEFDEGAMAFLNQASCAQVAVKTSISGTLLQFEGVRGVAYVVAGRHVTEWDN